MGAGDEIPETLSRVTPSKLFFQVTGNMAFTYKKKHSVSLKMFSDLPADSRAFTFDVGIKLSSSTNWHLVGEDLSLLSTHILKSSSELHRKLSFYGLILGISTLIHTSREYSYQLHMLNDLVLQSKI